jgi:hypothetical protein
VQIDLLSTHVVIVFGQRIKQAKTGIKGAHFAAARYVVVSNN